MPACGQNVASARNNAEPSIGCLRSWKFWCRRKSPGKFLDSNDTHALPARPRRTIQVESPLSVAELLDEITEVTALLFWCLMERSVKPAVVARSEIVEPGVSEPAATGLGVP